MSESDARAFLDSDEGNYELDQQLEVAKRFGIEVGPLLSDASTWLTRPQSVPFFTVDDERFHFSEAASTKEWFKVGRRLLRKMSTRSRGRHRCLTRVSDLGPPEPRLDAHGLGTVEATM